MRTDTQLLDELDKWKDEYDFNFQVWHSGCVNCFITKGDIHIATFAQNDTFREGLEKCIEWVNLENPSGIVHSEREVYRCMSCGCRIAKGDDLCGECAYEDDMDI
jgi:hypothetical protein